MDKILDELEKATTVLNSDTVLQMAKAIASLTAKVERLEKFITADNNA